MSINQINKSTLKPIALAVGLSLISAGPVVAGENKAEKAQEQSTLQKWQGEAYQGWLDGKVETALLLNKNLNPFKINTKTANGMVTLSGQVSSSVESELAEKIALSVKGVKGVNNNLEVSKSAKKADKTSGDKSFAQTVDDATTTATVKSKLLLENDVKGLAINVDTHYAVVTLTGKVNSSAAKDLAGLIAEQTNSVKSVNNKLVVMEDS